MEEIIRQYYADNARKLRQVVHMILKKFGGVSDKDYHDFYSVANDVFADIVRHHRYDPAKGCFDGFLYRALQLGIMDEFKRRNSAKRIARVEEVDEFGNQVLDEQGRPKTVPVADLCLDAPAGEEGNSTIIDQIPSKFDMDTMVLERMSSKKEGRVGRYLDTLPIIQRQILQMKMEGVPVSKIEQRLGISDGEYRKQFRQITSFQSIKAVRQLFINSSDVDSEIQNDRIWQYRTFGIERKKAESSCAKSKGLRRNETKGNPGIEMGESRWIAQRRRNAKKAERSSVENVSLKESQTECKPALDVLGSAQTTQYDQDKKRTDCSCTASTALKETPTKWHLQTDVSISGKTVQYGQGRKSAGFSCAESMPGKRSKADGNVGGKLPVSGCLVQGRLVGQGEDGMMMTVLTTEKSKPMQYSIASINKKIENRTIRFDHPLQRESDQWSPSMKGNLVSDILQGNPLPEIVFAEQIINGTPVIWDLDGKQRCTNCYSYANDGFKICRNIRKWKIQYLAQIRDVKGRPVLDENGFPMSEYQECDIRNKKFSQLPIELQEKFLDYTFKCDQYLNCDSEDIAYHIIRYNEGKAMSKSQKGITRIGEEFAVLVKEISAMSFFREGKGYKESEAKNGTLDRVVIESVMASKYLDHWSKQQEIICEYLKENAKVEDFREFRSMVKRLDCVITEEVSNLFDSKNSFLWFGLYARFLQTDCSDEAFIAFMSAFADTLHGKSIDGVSFDELCTDKKTGKARATKDKYIVLPKVILLEKLMLDFLDTKEGRAFVKHKNQSDSVRGRKKQAEIGKEEAFISEMVGIDPAEISHDLEFYRDSLKDLVGRTMKYGTELWQRKNRLCLLAIVAYSYQEDVDLEEWISGYMEKNPSNGSDQRKNYRHMVLDLKKFMQKQNL